MKLDLSKPILYLITRGATAEGTTAESREFHEVLNQISAAVAAGLDLVQIREKKLNARVLFALSERAVELTRGTATRVLINDRADIAAGVGAAGVHLTTESLGAATVRRTMGAEFVIGISTHSSDEASAARDEGADFAVFGPVFETPEKLKYGPPVGLEALSTICNNLKPFPILALGGVTKENAGACLRAGASGLSGISLFSQPSTLKTTVATIQDLFESIEQTP